MKEFELTDEQKEKLHNKIIQRNNEILSKIDNTYPIKGEFTDLSGKDIGYLHVDNYAGRYGKVSKNGIKRYKYYFQCTCKCGNTPIIRSDRLKEELNPSCGCRSIEAATKHGLSRNKKYAKLYKCLGHMIDRCYNPKCDHYHIYGGRGIKICDEWLIKENHQGLKNFINWSFENGYEPGLTIDRIDVDGNYCPENCRWVSSYDQSLNRTDNTYIQVERWVLPMICWSKILNISYSTIENRIYQYNWDPVDAILIPPNEKERIKIIDIPLEYEKYNKYDEWVKKGKIKPVEETIYKDCPYIEHK